MKYQDFSFYLKIISSSCTLKIPFFNNNNNNNNNNNKLTFLFIRIFTFLNRKYKYYISIILVGKGARHIYNVLLAKMDSSLALTSARSFVLIFF